MPINQSHIRSQRARQVTLFNLTSTVITTTAGVDGTAFEVSEYREGIFQHRMTVNTSGVVGIYLDAGQVPPSQTTTRWAQYATIDADLTTTANSVAVGVEVLPMFIRGRIPAVTTTAAVSTLTVTVEGTLKT